MKQIKSMHSTVILYGLLLPVDSIQILCLIFMKTVWLIEKNKVYWW
jgi:hypothetical protein